MNANDVVKIRIITAEIPCTSTDTDFIMDRSDTGHEQNAEEIPLHYEPMDYSIDGNEQNKEENPLQSATYDPAVPDGFHYVIPPAEFVLQFLLVEPTKYDSL